MKATEPHVPHLLSLMSGDRFSAQGRADKGSSIVLSPGQWWEDQRATHTLPDLHLVPIELTSDGL